MIIRLAVFLALSFALAGCGGQPQVPWSLEGKIVPEFTIIEQERMPEEFQTTFVLSVVVSVAITQENLVLVSQRIIEQLPRHNLAVIFYYSDAKDVNVPYTVGKAWWGVSDINQFSPAGDYTNHVLEVERK